MKKVATEEVRVSSPSPNLFESARQEDDCRGSELTFIAAETTPFSFEGEHSFNGRASSRIATGSTLFASK